MGKVGAGVCQIGEQEANGWKRTGSAAGQRPVSGRGQLTCINTPPGRSCIERCLPRGRQAVEKAAEKLSLTARYVTHDQQEALAISDRILVMNTARCTGWLAAGVV
jgi:hypothetical protein